MASTASRSTSSKHGVFNEVIAEAKAKSIPVVAFNIDAGKCSSGNLSYIVQDLKAAGEALGTQGRRLFETR